MFVRALSRACRDVSIPAALAHRLTCPSAHLDLAALLFLLFSRGLDHRVDRDRLARQNSGAKPCFRRSSYAGEVEPIEIFATSIDCDSDIGEGRRKPRPGQWPLVRSDRPLRQENDPVLRRLGRRAERRDYASGIRPDCRHGSIDAVGSTLVDVGDEQRDRTTAALDQSVW
jgi:hypothetical protein